MTAHEKQLAGLPYDPADRQIRILQNQAKKRMQRYNALDPENQAARAEVLRQLLGHCGRDVRVNQPFWIDFGQHIFLGDGCVVNLNCTFLDTGPITIGDYVLIGPDVKIYTAYHPASCAQRWTQRPDGSSMLVTATKPVVIGDHAWIGGGAILLPGVTIGDHAVIGAGSVVTGDIPPYAVACGNPCMIKKTGQ